MWELVYVLKKGNDVLELTEIADIEYCTDILGYEIESTYDRYTD